MQSVCEGVYISFYGRNILQAPERDGDSFSFNYRKLTNDTPFDVFCSQGEKGDVGNVGKTGPQVSSNSRTCFSLKD